MLYQSDTGNVTLDVQLNRESVWLHLEQMAMLFERDKSVISRHIKNIFEEGELDKKSVVANFATTAADGKTYNVDYYNLDVIISVGYRVKSVSGVRFRIWATNVLKQHLIKGYTLNQTRIQELKAHQLQEFEDAIGLIKKTIETKQLTNNEAEGLLKIVTDYTYTWILLQKYDAEMLDVPHKTGKAKYQLHYQEAQRAIIALRQMLAERKESTTLFGQERGDTLVGIIGSLYQTFGKHELYPSIEEKAAHLLYFIIKDHPFIDGNKRIASLLFLVFLTRNSYLFRKNGERKINDTALVALALLIAESEPKQKDVMIKLIMHFLKN